MNRLMTAQCLGRYFTQAINANNRFKFRTLISYTKDNPTTRISFPGNSTIMHKEPIKKPGQSLFEIIKQSSIKLKGIILPNGYPHTTKPKYLTYLGHIISASTMTTIINILTNQYLFIVLGNQTQGTALLSSSAFTWAIRENIGYFAGIVSAKRLAACLCEDIKKWRIIAFACMSGAYCLDLLTFAFPAHFILIAGLSTCIKNMSFIAIGGSSAYINLHFEANNNLADIAGKCSAQGSLGTMCGYIISAIISLKFNIENVYLFLPLIAVGAIINLSGASFVLKNIEIPYFNHYRLDLVIDHYIKTREILSPQSASKKENFFDSFKRNRKILMKKSRIGLTLNALSKEERLEILRIFEYEKFICLPYYTEKPWKGDRLQICYTNNTSNEEVIIGYMLALKIQESMNKRHTLHDAAEYILRNHPSCKRKEFVDQLIAAGWKTNYLYAPFDDHTYEVQKLKA